MKICDLTQFYSPVSGGVKRYVMEKRSFINASRPDVQHLLIVPGADSTREVDGRCVTCTIGSPLISRTSRYRALLNLAAVEQILENEKPDIIESGDPYQMAWKAIATGKAMHVPVVGFYHSHFPEAYLRSTMKYFGKLATEIAMDISQRYIHNLYSRFACTLVPSEGLVSLLKEWGVENSVQTDLGVNTDVFRPEPKDAAETRKGLGIPVSPILLLYVGRLAAEKNTRTLFQAFRLLHARHPGRFHFLCVGDGLQRGLLAELASETHSVTTIPYSADSAELARFYRAADLFVHPGILETFGLVTLESQACGTPVVGIRGSYMDRIIFSDQEGWARENTPESLAAAILRESHHDFQRSGARAAALVHARFGWKDVFARLFKIYENVIVSYKSP